MLRAGGGYIITTAFRAATMTKSKMSSYQIGKLSAVRLTELIHNKYNDKGIKSIAIHPGGIVMRLLTDIEKETEPWAKDIGKFVRPHLQETISLPGNSCIFLASSKADFLSGRYIDTTINFDQLLEEKEAIIKHDLFKVGITGNWNTNGGFVKL
jgi:NAD(P)-dependent dehydrogenase (short-subunit alcohol dehydrogenase family)